MACTLGSSEALWKVGRLSQNSKKSGSALSFQQFGGNASLNVTSSSRNLWSLSVSMQDSLPDLGEDDATLTRQYPTGVQRYESMLIVRPDITDDERIKLIERYEEKLIAGGALDVEMFNRGMQPLAYGIKSVNTAGDKFRYVDGIYLLFTYVTKPQSQIELQQVFKLDDDIIRSSTFRLKL